MKRIATVLFMAALVAVVGAGCATTPAPSAFAGDEQLGEAYQRYLAINPEALTPDQVAAVHEFDEVCAGFTQKDWEFINSYPWLDRHNLSDSDKAFLIGEAKGIYKAIMWAS